MFSLTFYNNILQEMADLTDPRTKNWLFLTSIVPLLYVFVLYFFIVYYAGPRFMKAKEPYSLKRYIQYFNVLQVIANFLIVYNIAIEGKVFYTFSRYCDSFDDVYADKSLKHLHIIWWTLMLKIFDLSETIVYVLRKKTGQITFLHVYHHTFTIYVYWLCITYLIHTVGLMVITVNCSVHVLMYLYYFLATFGSDMQRRFVTLKKLMTIVQMVQFVFLISLTWPGYTSACNNKSFYISTLLNFTCGSYLILFLHFYKKSYINKRAKTA